MKFSLAWLKRYLDTDASAAEISVAEASVSRNTLSQSSENFMPAPPPRR
jgi:hypothetical protein